MTLHQQMEPLGITDEESRIYEHLLRTGTQTVSETARALRYPRPSMYGVVARLASRGIIIESFKNNVKYISAAHPEKVLGLLKQKIQETTQAYTDFEHLIPTLSPTTAHTPQFQYYHGTEGLQFVLNDMLLKRDIATEAFWPIQSMIDLLSAKFFKHLNQERIQRNIHTRAIWPQSQIIDTEKHPYLGSGEKFLREIRIAPQQVDFTMGYWIYGDRVAFLSSNAEAYGFIVESPELTTMLRTQFDLVWNLSKPIKEKTNSAVEKFLDDIYKPQI